MFKSSRQKNCFLLLHDFVHVPELCKNERPGRKPQHRDQRGGSPLQAARVGVAVSVSLEASLLPNILTDAFFRGAEKNLSYNNRTQVKTSYVDRIGKVSLQTLEAL